MSYVAEQPVSTCQPERTTSQSELTLAAREAVAEIAEHGDALDCTKYTDRYPVAGKTAGVATAASSILAGIHSFYPPDIVFGVGTGSILTTSIGSGVAVAGGYETRKRIEARRYLSGLDAVEAATDGDHGLVLEVIRGQDKQVQLVWHDKEVLPAERLAEQLAAVHEVADRADIDLITLNADLVADHADSEILEHAQSQYAWFKQTKGYQILRKSGSSHEVVSVSRDELNEIRAKAEMSSQVEPLDSIMRVLRRVQPQHPAVKDYFNRFSVDRNKARLEQKIKSAIERPLHDATAQIIWDEDNFYLGKSKLHRSAMISTNGGKPIVRYLDSRGNHSEITQLLREMGLERMNFREVLNNWHNLPKSKTAKWCELAAWMTLHGYDVGIDSESLAFEDSLGVSQDHEPALVEPGHAIQASFRDAYFGDRATKKAERQDGIIDLDGLSQRRMKKVMAWGAGIVLLSGITANRIEERSYNVYSEEHDPYWWWHDFTNFAYFTPGDYGLVAIDEARDALGINPPESQLQPNSRYSDLNFTSENITRDREEANVGNIESSGENRVIWNIKERNGADANGYWPDVILPQLSSWYSGVLQWNAVRYTPADEIITLNNFNDVFEGNDPMLVVRGLVDPSTPDGDYCAEEVVTNQNSDNIICSALTVPVREGMKIAAARFVDYPDIEIYTAIDPGNITRLYYPSDFIPTRDAKIEYILIPDDTYQPAQHIPKLDVIHPDIEKIFELKDDTEKDKFYAQAERELTAQATAVWEEFLGHQMPDDPEERLALQVAHIRSFEYDLAPLPNGLPEKGYIGYLREVLQAGKANCNVANTAIALSNPELVVGVAGFNNGDRSGGTLPEGESIISKHEAHLWLLHQKTGETIDATPSGSAKFADHFEEQYEQAVSQKQAQDQQRNRVLKVALASIGLAAAVLAVRRRRQLAQLPHATASTASRLYLKGLTTEQIREAHAQLNHSLWSDDPHGQADPASSLGDKQQLLESLESYSNTDKIQPKGTGRRYLRRANRIMSAQARLRKAQEIPSAAN